MTTDTAATAAAAAVEMEQKMWLPTLMAVGLAVFLLLRWAVPWIHGTMDVVLHMDDLLDMCLLRVRETGDNYALRVIGQPLHLVTVSPKDAAHVLVHKFKNYHKGPAMHRRFYPLLGNGIFNNDGKLWYTSRKVTSLMFNVKNFKGHYLAVFNNNVGTMLDILHAKSRAEEAIDMQQLFYSFTLDSIGEIAFGEDIGALRTAGGVPFGKSFDYVQQRINESFLDPLWLLKRYLTADGRLFFHHLRELKSFALRVVQDRRKDPERETRGDLLSIFLQRQKPGVQEFDDEYLVDLVMNMVIAGRDTTAVALSWSIYSMCKQPEVQDRLHDEISQINWNENGSEVTYADIKNLVYTTAFFMEVLRLYPSVPKEVKYAINDDVLPSGRKVRAGDGVAFVPWAMGRMEDIWGADAAEFRPERFIREDGSGVIQPPAAKWIAFQAGPRTCLGQAMAMLEAQVAIARLVRNFRFTMEEGQTIHYANSLTLPMKNGVRVFVTPRIPETS